MKKILGISLVAVLAVSPMMAEAAYTKATTSLETDSNVASAGYVKGAYNAAIDAMEEVAATKQDKIEDLATIKAGAAAGATALQANSALNGANLTAGTVARTALSSEVQASLGLADTALQSAALNDYAKTADVTSAIATAKTEAATDATTKADAAQAAAESYTDTQLEAYTTTTNMNTLLDGKVNTSAISSALSSTSTDGQVASAKAAYAAANAAETAAKSYADGLATNYDAAGAAADAQAAAESYARDGSHLTAGTVAKTALSSEVQASLGLADTALQSAALNGYATETGVAATVNAATVAYDIMQTWGSDSATSATYDVAVASYVAQ